MPEPLIETIDLSREMLRLHICGICRALVMMADKQAHYDWHGARDA